MVVGKRLAERWQLPAVIRDCIWLHGQPPQALPAAVRNPRLVNLVTLADLLVREQHLGYSGNYTFPLSREASWKPSGLTPAQLDFGHAAPGRAHRAAGAGAGARAGQHRRALPARPGAGQPGAGPGQQPTGGQEPQADGPVAVLRRPEPFPERPAPRRRAAGGAAGDRADGRGRAGRRASAAAFSLPPGQDYAETLLCDDQGEVFGDVAGGPAGDEPGDRRRHRWRWAEPGMRTRGAAGGVAGGAVGFVAAASCATGRRLRAGEAARATRHRREAAARPIPPVAPTSPRPATGRCCRRRGRSSGWSASSRRGWPTTSGSGSAWKPTAPASAASSGARRPARRSGSARRRRNCAALASGWSLALRTAQIREEARTLAEQLAEANRRLHDAQDEMLRSKTMLSVGEMAAGAAHEMNNPLAVISGRSQLLAQQLTDPKHKATAHLIHEQSHRLSSIITELMDFARPEPPAPARCELADMVQRALHEAKMHNDPADRTIEVTIGDVPLVRVDERQVAAAMTEVIDNAIQATDASAGPRRDPRGLRRVLRPGGGDRHRQRLRDGREDGPAGVRPVLQQQARRPPPGAGPGQGAAMDRSQAAGRSGWRAGSARARGPSCCCPLPAPQAGAGPAESTPPRARAAQ